MLLLQEVGADQRRINEAIGPVQHEAVVPRRGEM
jgi:hypothetical protein